MTEQKTELIRQLNDRTRKNLGIDGGCRVMVTPGVATRLDAADIMFKVAEFKDFTEDNDPHGEHDFGAFDHLGNKIFFKFDYYDKNFEYMSEDPSDPAKTNRVLTVMLSEEY